MLAVEKPSFRAKLSPWILGPSTDFAFAPVDSGEKRVDFSVQLFALSGSGFLLRPVPLTWTVVGGWERPPRSGTSHALVCKTRILLSVGDNFSSICQKKTKTVSFSSSRNFYIFLFHRNRGRAFLLCRRLVVHSHFQELVEVDRMF